MAARTVGRYVLLEEIGHGGMAVVHLARLEGDVGFARTVAIKRLHDHLAHDAELSSMLRDEARLLARVRHPNVVPIRDVVVERGELCLVMDLVRGESLAQLARGERAPVPVSVAIVVGILYGLHAAHEARSEAGAPLGIVHRDVSPQNVLVGTDGIPRVVDFGIAKAVGRLQTTRRGEVKGKASYMAPEQLWGETLDHRADVYAAAVVLWELLAGERLFDGESYEATVNLVLEREVPAPSTKNPDVTPELDAVVLRGLARERDERFASAREMASALEAATPIASAHGIGEWVERVAGARVRSRLASVVEDETDTVREPPREVLASAAERAPASRKSAVRGALALGVVLLGIGAVALAARPSGAESAATSAKSSEPVASSPPVTASAPAAASTPPAAPSSAPPVASARPSPPIPRRPVRRVRSCDPPYVIDSSGFRSPKPECL